MGLPVYHTAHARPPPISVNTPKVSPTPNPTELTEVDAELGEFCGATVGDLVRVMVLEGDREGVEGGVKEAEGENDGVEEREFLESGQRHCPSKLSCSAKVSCASIHSCLLFLLPPFS
jgi:hypothetical protein